MDIQQLIARRVGRITFGAVLLAGAAFLVMSATGRVTRGPWLELPPDVDAAQVISATWVIALLGGAIAQRLARRLPPRWHPGALFTESVLVPVIGIALLLPLTLHMPLALLISDRRGFDSWVGMSLWITGFAHVVFALASALRGYQLVLGKPAWSPRQIYLLTVLASCVPFIILAGIPPLIVAVTALPCMPLLGVLERIVVRERGEIAAAPQLLPRAVAVIPSPPA